MSGMCSSSFDVASRAPKHRSKLGVTNVHRVFQHSIEDRLQFAWRTADDLEHIGGGGLLLKRFTQLIEQPRVLDGDYGLCGEVLHQFNLFIGEGAYLCAIDEKGTKQFIVLEHRHRDGGSRTAVSERGAGFWIGCPIDDIYDGL